MQIEQQKEQQEQQPIDESNPYSLFVYAVRSQGIIILGGYGYSLIISIYFLEEQWKKGVTCLWQKGKRIQIGPLVAL
jgi:hypothetical protein